MPGAPLTVHPGPVRGGVLGVPGDKSVSHRALLIAALAEGETRIRGLLESEDCLATVAALRALGVAVEKTGEEWRVVGRGMDGWRAPSGVIDCGNSGTAMRLLAGMLAGQPFVATLTGDASLRSRPMRRVAEPLGLMGAAIETTSAGTAPLIVHGSAHLEAIEYRLPVTSAQVKSAILLAGLRADGETRVIEPGISRDHTEIMLTAFGVPVSTEGNTVRLHGPARPVSPGLLEVPGDLSSAAFFLVLAALSSGCRIELRNVGVNPTRDGVLRLLRRMGANIEVRNLRETAAGEPVADLVAGYAPLRGIVIGPEDVALAIDEIPVLLIAAAQAQGRTVLRGAGELRVKESDRLAVMARNLRALGISVEEYEDGLAVEGGRLRGGEVDAAGDHRIAMAFAVAATVADAPVTIMNSDNIRTSYPGFAADARQLGVDVREQP